ELCLPGLALQFAIVTMGSALRGTGIVKPTMAIQALTVLLNTVLAPVLIAGWGTGRAFGVAGAGLASSISVAVGVAMLTYYFVRLSSIGSSPVSGRRVRRAAGSAPASCSRSSRPGCQARSDRDRTRARTSAEDGRD